MNRLDDWFACERFAAWIQNKRFCCSKHEILLFETRDFAVQNTRFCCSKHEILLFKTRDFALQNTKFCSSKHKTLLFKTRDFALQNTKFCCFCSSWEGNPGKHSTELAPKHGMDILITQKLKLFIDKWYKPLQFWIKLYFIPFILFATRDCVYEIHTFYSCSLFTYSCWHAQIRHTYCMSDSVLLLI